MNYTIQTGLTGAALRAALPFRFRLQLSKNMGDHRYALLFFRNGGKELILSKDVECALQSMGNMQDSLVAVGGRFAMEGVTMLRARSAIVLQSQWWWKNYSRAVILKRMLIGFIMLLALTSPGSAHLKLLGIALLC